MGLSPVLKPQGRRRFHEAAGTASLSHVQELSLGSTAISDKVVVTVRGDLDAHTAPRLRGTLSDLIDGQGVRSLVVDLEGLTFIDSAGVYALVQELKHVRCRGGDLALSGVRSGAHKVLDVCRLTSAFGAVDTSAPPPAHGE